MGLADGPEGITPDQNIKDAARLLADYERGLVPANHAASDFRGAISQIESAMANENLETQASIDRYKKLEAVLARLNKVYGALAAKQNEFERVTAAHLLGSSGSWIPKAVIRPQ